MAQPEEVTQHLREIRKKIGFRLLINVLAPVILYTLLHYYLGVTDLIALAIGTAIPAVQTIAVLVWHRRVDSIGILAILGFGIALGVSVLSGGSSLLFEVHGALLTGTLGLVLLVSVIIGKPLWLPLMQFAARSNPTLASILEKRLKNPSSRKRIAIITAGIGLALFGHAAGQVILALTLPVGTFLVVSKVFTWTIVGIAVAFLWWMRRGTK